MRITVGFIEDRAFAAKVDHDEGEQGCCPTVEQKLNEIPHVVETYAVIKPRAMMVKSQNACVASRAVVSSRRFVFAFSRTLCTDFSDIFIVFKIVLNSDLYRAQIRSQAFKRQNVVCCK